jgi:hypothetical protein
MAVQDHRGLVEEIPFLKRTHAYGYDSSTLFTSLSMLSRFHVTLLLSDNHLHNTPGFGVHVSCCIPRRYESFFYLSFFLLGMAALFVWSPIAI